MSVTKKFAAIASVAAMAATTGVIAAPAAQAADPGSLAEVLLSDDSGFDRDRRDYDIVTAAALAVLGAKPDSPVGLLTQGDVALTAFLPNDQAFRFLVRDLTGQYVRAEADVFAAVASLGIDTVEFVLLYHVYPGGAIDSASAVQADGVELTMADGGSITVDVLAPRAALVRLVDNDTDARDPFLDRRNLDIRAGAQIAHGIDRVLRPIDLP